MTPSKVFVNRQDPEAKLELTNLAEKVKIQVVTEGTASFMYRGERLRLDLDTFNCLTQHLADKFLPPILEAGRTAMIDWANK